MDQVQRELREIKGLSVLVYDQTCAAEKRRRRKRGLYPDPPKRVFINDLVCEGCGDCSQTSNCVSVQPLDTEFGRKRQIDQSNCNKDYSCVEGFCPSFVTVHGWRLAEARPASSIDSRPAVRRSSLAAKARWMPYNSSSPASEAPASSSRSALLLGMAARRPRLFRARLSRSCAEKRRESINHPGSPQSEDIATVRIARAAPISFSAAISWCQLRPRDRVERGATLAIVNADLQPPPAS